MLDVDPPFTATIIAFPVPASTGALPQLSSSGLIATGVAPISAAALATKFTDHFLPIAQAGIDLLEADEQDFEDRCRRMLDTDGTAMIDELCAELEIVGGQMRILVDGLELTRARLRTAMTSLTSTADRPNEEAS